MEESFNSLRNNSSRKLSDFFDDDPGPRAVVLLYTQVRLNLGMTVYIENSQFSGEVWS